MATNPATLTESGWKAGGSNFPASLFPSNGCTITVTPGTSGSSLSWTYGGQPAGSCTLGPISLTGDSTGATLTYPPTASDTVNVSLTVTTANGTTTYAFGLMVEAADGGVGNANCGQFTATST